jgi:twinkle protein
MRFIDHGIIIDPEGHQQQYTTCPVCGPTRKKSFAKSLSVNIEKEIWNCHHCDFSGSLREYKVKYSNNFKKVKVKPKIYKKPEAMTMKLSISVVEWFLKRGIQQHTLEISNVSCEISWMPQTNKQEPCIIFNYFIGNELINRKYRDNNKNMRLEKDCRLVFYAPSRVADVYYDKNVPVEKIYITEGEVDALTMVELGFKETISTPNGAPPDKVNIQEADLSYLDSLYEIAPAAERFVLVMDTDKVGVKLRNEIARRLGVERCFFADYPKECKDINEVLVKFGKEKATECVDSAKPYPIEGSYQVQDLAPSILNLYENGFDRALSIGIPTVDRLYTVRPQEFTIVSGVPNHGKSAFLDNLAVNMASLHKWKFGVFSPENFPFERHIASLANTYIKKPFDRKYNGFMDMNDLERAMEFLNKNFIFLMPENDSPSIDDIFRIAKASIFRHGINGLIIDPWNELEHNRNGKSETEYVSEALSKTRKFCRVNNVHVWLVAHPMKLQKNKNGDYPVPTPYDISGSAHWRNKADNVICIHRDFEENTNTFYSQKIRFKDVGKVGDCELRFDIKENRFYGV